jgi:hypothetical protein
MVTVTLLAIGTAYWLDAGERPVERPKVWPKPTEPPPASPNYRDTKERMPSEEDIERDARERPAMLEREIERALLAGNAEQRETAFAVLLPELLQVEPRRLVDLVARMEPGEPRDTLRVEIASLWIQQDAQAATRWLKSLDKGDRREAAVAAVTSLAPSDPDQARALVREFDLGRDARLRELLSATER